jgi:hypothetical protein
VHDHTTGYRSLCSLTFKHRPKFCTLPAAVLVVLSSDFIRTDFPMEQLQLLHERCRRNPSTPTVVVPVFYDVSFRDLSITACSYLRGGSTHQQWAESLFSLGEMAGIRRGQVRLCQQCVVLRAEQQMRGICAVLRCRVLGSVCRLTSSERQIQLQELLLLTHPLCLTFLVALTRWSGVALAAVHKRDIAAWVGGVAAQQPCTAAKDVHLSIHLPDKSAFERLPVHSQPPSCPLACREAAPSSSGPRVSVA